MYLLEPKLQIRNDCLLYYNLPTLRPGYTRDLSQIKTYGGKVTFGAAKRIRQAIDILIQKSPTRTTYNPVTQKYFPFKINFITLTLSCSQIISANFGYSNLMRPFLRKMRKHGNFRYVWKAELQKSGQLHYHLATNTFLPWQEVRNTWNNLQRKNRLLDEYATRNRHFDANSTDIHALTNIANIGTYLSKYLAKNNTKAIKGKIWDCSKDLKESRFHFTPTNSQEIFIKNLEEDNQVKIIELEHCTIIKGIPITRILTPIQLAAYHQWTL